MQLQILGSNSGGLFIKRHFSAQLLYCKQNVYLIDCGEGTQMQIARYGRRIDRLDQIFISHMHGDHVLGLVGLISSFAMRQRTRPLQVFGPEGLQRFLSVQIELCDIHLPFEVKVHTVSCKRSVQIFEDSDVTVRTIPLKHRVPAVGFCFKTKPAKLHNIRKVAIEQFGLSIEQIRDAKQGKPVYTATGDLIPPDSIVLPTKPSVSYAYCSDTAYSDSIAEYVKGVDLLYHEATFTEKHKQTAEWTGHSTAKDAALIAQKAGVGKLLLGHLSGRYNTWEEHLLEARTIFANTHGAEDGEIYQISSGD